MSPVMGPELRGPRRPIESRSAVVPKRLKMAAKGSKVFVTPMDKNLDGFIVAEIQKQKLPLEIVLKQDDAQYVLTGFSQMTGSHWAEQVATSVFGGKDKYEAECKLITGDGKTLIWSGEAGDRFPLSRCAQTWRAAESC